MEQNEAITQQLQQVYTQIEKHLQEGITYYSTPAVSSYGTSGGNLFRVENDQRVYFDRDEVEGPDLFSITRQFPVHTIVRYTIRKGMPITVEASTPQMLLEEMKLSMKEEQRRTAERNRLLEMGADNDLAKIETHVKFLKKGKMDVLEKEISINGSIYEKDYSCLEQEIEAMRLAIDGAIDKMVISMENDILTIHSTPAIPGLTVEAVEQEEDLTLDESSLEAIYAFMESQNDAKMTKAVEVLKRSPDFLEKAEKRYLHLVAARLNNKSATLEQFPEAALRKAEVNTLLGKHFAKDFISLSYFDENESKLVVDFIGSMVQSAIDVEAYSAEAVQLTGKDELIALYDAYASKAKATILEEAKVYPEGWYAQVSTHLIGLQLRRVLFEKTQFDDANASLALKSFVFFLNINCPKSVYLDIFQSDVPDLTEMFWLLKAVPDTSWGDTTLKLSDSPLKFERCARYRIGDEGNWKKICKP